MNHEYDEIVIARQVATKDAHAHRNFWHVPEVRRGCEGALATTHRVAAVQAAVARAVANGDVTACRTHRGIAHHLRKLSVQRIGLRKMHSRRRRPSRFEVREAHLLFGRDRSGRNRRTFHRKIQLIDQLFALDRS